ncbi:neurexophilin and PC-esterase domain family member 2 L homeolog isoform X2 [Xenopus laevis]|uniref:Neurexophilin and PC-esterase domain family member 2 L homeolog isoform X2 n=1 Tax=Xenopus laevis TaxID=8355 RepID=A0A8J1L4N5_XENLA|nr:neurexophilin and PC-esterase domain family member 2 L homeolog isoform X2 [Xenopus laevis]
MISDEPHYVRKTEENSEASSLIAKHCKHKTNPLIFRMKFLSKIILAAAAMILIKFLVFREGKTQVPKATYPFHMQSDQSHKEVHSSKSAPVQDALNQRIEEIYNRIDKLIPKIKLKNFAEATSAEKSKATIVNQKDSYCLGEQLFVRVQAYDYLENIKSYGGDYLRARIFSPKTNSSASGNITDYNNGTYLIAFTLFWEGEVSASVLLMHPSEAVSALWRARNQGFDNILYTGNFTSATEYVNRKCGFQLETEEDICQYVDRRDQEAFYCIKPPNFPCEALTHMNSVNRNHSYLSEVEKLLLNRSNIGVEISKNFKTINVSNCGILDYFNHTEDEMQSWQKTLLAINLENFIYVQWKKHTFPFVSKTFYSIKEDAYMARQIDQIGGGINTILILTMGQHFRPFNFHIFIKSALNVRRAIERLFYRSPSTKVIIKEENARDMDIDMERFSDFHGHIQYHVLREVFHGLNVGFVDALDMTIAYACNVIHPPVEVLENIISMSFTQATS